MTETKDLAERLREAGELAVKATTWEDASTDPFERCVRAALAVQIPGPHIADRVCSSGDMEAIPGTCYLTADQMKYVVAAVLAAYRLSEPRLASAAKAEARCKDYERRIGKARLLLQALDAVESAELDRILEGDTPSSERAEEKQ